VPQVMREMEELTTGDKWKATNRSNVESLQAVQPSAELAARNPEQGSALEGVAGRSPDGGCARSWRDPTLDRPRHPEGAGHGRCPRAKDRKLNAQAEPLRDEDWTRRRTGPRALLTQTPRSSDLRKSASDPAAGEGKSYRDEQRTALFAYQQGEALDGGT